MAVSQQKITLYNLADLKNTSDDAISNYLNSLKVKQSHYLNDVRLFLGYSAFLIAAACFVWDYKFGFDATKKYTAGAVALYSILNTMLTLWIWLKEKGIIYVGEAPDGTALTITSHTEKNVPIYNLDITIVPKNGKHSTVNISNFFTNWFDVAGNLIAVPLQIMLASSVPPIGILDPKNANILYNEEELDLMLDAAGATPENAVKATGSSAAKKGGRKRTS